MRYSINKNKYLISTELNALETLLTKNLDSDPRNSLLLLVKLRTGARASELLNLRKTSLDVDSETILIEGLKGSSDREIPLPKALFLRLRMYSLTVQGDRLFPISYNRLRQIWDLYRPCAKKLHSLRHTFAIELYKKTRDLRLVQVALGHRNIQNTMVYSEYVYSTTELRRLIL